MVNLIPYKLPPMNTNIPSPFQDKPATMALPMRTNWNGAILIGVIWLVLGLGGGSIWAHIGTKRQAASYQAALAALIAMPEAAGLEQPPAQHACERGGRPLRARWKSTETQAASSPA